MFNVFDRLIVDWPVRVDVGDGEERKLAPPVKFKLEILPSDETAALAISGEWNPVFRRVVHGWDESQMADADGALLKYSPDNLDRLLRMPRMNTALQVAYFEACAGVRRKN